MLKLRCQRNNIKCTSIFTVLSLLVFRCVCNYFGKLIKEKKKKIFNTHHVYILRRIYLYSRFMLRALCTKKEWLNCDDTFGMYVFSVSSVDEREKETKYNLSIMSLISFFLFFNVLVIVRIFSSRICTSRSC